MAAIVERDDAAAVLPQLGNPGRIHPVDVLGRGEAVHEQNRIALALVEIGDFNIAIVKTRHRSFVPCWGKEADPRMAPKQRRLPAPCPATKAPPPSAVAAAAPSSASATPA